MSVVVPLKSEVSARRRLLQNPYAHLEQLEALEGQVGGEVRQPSLTEQIAASRRLYQNPYAYLDEAGDYSVAAPVECLPVAASEIPVQVFPGVVRGSQHRYSDREIEAQVTDLQRLVWRKRATLWGSAVPVDPVELLDPEAALKLLGYGYLLDEGLGQFHTGKGVVEVAGLIDHASKTVRVSRWFPTHTRTFTAAHELGHAALHASSGGMHRDRPMDGLVYSRNPLEVEANKFASYFLMPAKLVIARFVEIFGVACFRLTMEAAFALSSRDLPEARKEYRSVRDLSRHLASANRFNGRHVIPLADQFRVSVETMAIRLEELHLLEL